MKACPFCNSLRTEFRRGARPQVRCTTCGAEGPEAETTENALVLWNHRAEATT